MRCSSPYIFTACVGALLSVALFGCKYSIVEIVVGNSFTRFKIHTLCYLFDKVYRINDTFFNIVHLPDCFIQFLS